MSSRYPAPTRAVWWFTEISATFMRTDNTHSVRAERLSVETTVVFSTTITMDTTSCPRSWQNQPQRSLKRCRWNQEHANDWSGERMLKLGQHFVLSTPWPDNPVTGYIDRVLYAAWVKVNVSSNAFLSVRQTVKRQGTVHACEASFQLGLER